MADILYKELSYKVVGSVYDVYNELKFGHREKIYQKALAEELSSQSIKFAKEVNLPIKYQNRIIGRYYFDFLIESKLILELKVGNEILDSYVNQILSYLKSSRLRLGIIVVFSKESVKMKRIVN